MQQPYYSGLPQGGYATGAIPSAQQQAVYVYQGQKYSDFRQLQAAMQQPGVAPSTPWVEVLKDPALLAPKPPLKSRFKRI